MKQVEFHTVLFVKSSGNDSVILRVFLGISSMQASKRWKCGLLQISEYKCYVSFTPALNTVTFGSPKHCSRCFPFSPPKDSIVPISADTSFGRTPTFSNSWTSFRTSHTWCEMFEDENWLEMRCPMIHTQEGNSYATLTIELGRFRVLQFVQSIEESLLLVAYRYSCHHLRSVLPRNPLNVVLCHVYSYTLGAKKAQQTHSMGSLDLAVKNQKYDEWHSSS